MSTSFEERIPAMRARMRKEPAQFKKQVAESPFGPRSRALLEQMIDYESLGGVGFALFATPPVIVRGEGARVWDADGKEYIDLLAGFSVSNLGHGHPAVVNAIKAQAEKLIHYFDFPNEQREPLAERLTKLVFGDVPARVAFSVTGGEAIDVAIRAARYYTGGQFILSAYGAYHGVTIGTLGLTTKGGIWATHYPVLPAQAGVERFPYAYCYRCAFGKEPSTCGMHCVQYVREFFRGKETPYAEASNRISNVAAIIVESMQASAGYIVPPDAFLRGLREICDDYGMLLIVDEIQAGTCRSGKWWGFQHSGILPDIVTVAKGIANGLPVSGTVARQEILEAWGPASHISTFAAYPLVCAASNAALDTLVEERMEQRAAETGAYFLDGLRDLARRHPIVGEIAAKGLFIGLEFVRDRRTKEPAIEEAAFMLNECVKEGVLFEKGGYLYNRFQLIAPLVIARSEVDRVLQIFDKVFGEAERRFAIPATSEPFWVDNGVTTLE